MEALVAVAALPLGYWNGALVHSATQILAFQERKLEFIKMFNDKPLLISVDRSLLTVILHCEKPSLHTNPPSP